jgi:hypothetical protein
MKLGFLELSPDERRFYIDQAALQQNLSAVIVEKDFWVCWLLAVLNNPLGREGPRVHGLRTGSVGILPGTALRIHLLNEASLPGELRKSRKSHALRRIKRISRERLPRSGSRALKLRLDAEMIVGALQTAGSLCGGACGVRLLLAALFFGRE